MLRVYAKRFHSLLIATDVLVSAAVFFALLSRPGLGPQPPIDDLVVLRLVALGLVASLAWPLILDQLELYASQRHAELGDVLGRLTLAGTISTALLGLVTFGLQVPVAALFPLICGVGQLLALACLRMLILTALRTARRHGRNYRNVFIVGSGPRAHDFLEVVERHPEWGLHVGGFIDDSDAPVDERLDGQNVCKLADTPKLLKEEVIDEIIVACPRSLLASISPLVSLCAEAGIPVTMLSDVFGDYLPPPRVTRFASVSALNFATVHHNRAALAVKRATDVVGAGVLLLLFAPVIGIAAGLIRATSRGPIFFRQMRSGLYGRRFEMLKLRTMRVDAEELKDELLELNEMDGPVFKIRNDPRITGVGRWLRRFSVDELPQLWNVLCGDMSLVGPRPPLPVEVEEYATFQRRRLSMRPGITCLWQVSGRNLLSFEDWVKLDLEYIDGWSLMKDAGILVRTIPAVVRGKGAS